MSSFFLETTRSSQAIVGTYVTEPGTALGEGERVNLIRPTVSEITLHFPNITAGQYVNISEVCWLRLAKNDWARAEETAAIWS